MILITCTYKALMFLTKELKNNGVPFKTNDYNIIVEDNFKSRTALRLCKENNYQYLTKTI